jgi:YD repeat-containing protein
MGISRLAVVVLIFGALFWSQCGAQSLPGTETYTYDALGRLTSVAYPNATTVTYNYDPAGNRSTVQATDTSPPSAPGKPTFTNLTTTSVTVSWTAATDNIGVASYEYELNSGAWTNVGTALTVNLTGLTSGTTYTVSVHAKDAGGTIGPSSMGSVTTNFIPPGAPGTPSASSITSTTATVSWTAASGTVTSYAYSINGGGTWTSVGTALTASLTGLTKATTYTVQVHASNAGGTGPNSSASFTTAASDTVTMTQGTYVSGPITLDGFNSGQFGSVSPSTLTGGKTILQLMDAYNGPPFIYTQLIISGFTSDPGQSWLTSVTANGVTRSGASAAYSYANGSAQWDWYPPTFSAMRFGPSGTTAVTFVHK